MKKEMNIIVSLYKNGVQFNFERFSCKRLSTVLNQYREKYCGGDYTGLWTLFFRDYLEADKIVVYSTPNHYSKGPILAEYTSNEFISSIS